MGTTLELSITVRESEGLPRQPSTKRVRFAESVIYADRRKRVQGHEDTQCTDRTNAYPIRACWRMALVLAQKQRIKSGAPLLSLPHEILERVLGFCDVKQLAALEMSCRQFIGDGLIQRVAHQQLMKTPRVQHLHPEFGETWLTLLHFTQQQSEAAAQATALSLGAYHTLAIFASPAFCHGYQLASFGRGFHGQLGNGCFDGAATPQVYIKNSELLIGSHTTERTALPRPAVVACGSEHSLAIDCCGQLFTWGLSGAGELGRPEEGSLDTARPRPVGRWQPCRMVSLAAGAHHTLCISDCGAVWSCGRGDSGQLGTGACKDSFLLQRVQLWCGSIAAVAAGDAHSVALGLDGRVWTWGSAARGQLGHAMALPAGESDPNCTPAASAAVPMPRMIAALHPSGLAPGQRVTAISAGAHHTILLTVAGTLLAFGCNRHGCLGLGDDMDRDVPTRVCLQHVSSSSQSPVRVVQVACGRAHTLVLAHCAGRRLVLAAGYNFFGQLGVGDTAPRVMFTEVAALREKRVVAIAAGDHHCGAVTECGELYMWGRGDCGQLGNASDRNQCTPVLLPGVSVVHPDVTLRRRPNPRN